MTQLYFRDNPIKFAIWIVIHLEFFLNCLLSHASDISDNKQFNNYNSKYYCNKIKNQINQSKDQFISFIKNINQHTNNNLKNLTM